MRVLGVCTGSWGDVLPWVAVSLALVRHGDECTIATSPQYVPTLRKLGVKAIGIGLAFNSRRVAEFGAAICGDGTGLSGFDYYWTRMVLNDAAKSCEQLSDLVASSAKFDVVLAHYHSIPALAIARRFRIPRVVLIPAGPSCLPNECYSPSHAIQRSGDFASALDPTRTDLHRRSWLEALRWSEERLDERTFQVMREVGIEEVPQSALTLPLAGEDRVLVASFRHLLPDNVAFDPRLHFVGYPMFDFLAPPPSEVENFLLSGRAPVVVTFGTAVARGLHEAYLTVAEALLSKGQRVICVGGPAPVSPDALSTVFAPISWLAPRSRAVVHHGGPGTLMTVLSAGKPSTIIPRFVDQPFHAAQAEFLGIGKGISPVHMSPYVLDRALDWMMSPVAVHCSELQSSGVDDSAASLITRHLQDSVRA